ncbi:MAG: hypothetical protein K2M01_00365 [Paramuribaculum sp.]|nr:hypothetical protein [Paramuribaculum sp.]
MANNVFAVSVSEGLRAWTTLKPRFAEFATPLSAEKPVLEVEVKSMELPEYAGERIYEPVHGGIGFISSCASRMGDGSLALEFRHVADAEPRLLMIMPSTLDRADITIASDGDDNDSYFLSHALMIAFMIATCGNGTLLFHSSAVVYSGKAYLFQGKSGTGKSTHARLWTEHIVGAELLNDDNPLISFAEDGTAMAYGSPWSGKTHCYRNVAAPVGAIVRIVRGAENSLRRLAPLKAYASLTASVFFMPFLSEELREKRHKTIERLAGSVACCEMHCRPDADAALTCMRGLMIYANN